MSPTVYPSYTKVLADKLAEIDKERTAALSLRDVSQIVEDAKVRFSDDLPDMSLSMQAYSFAPLVNIHVTLDDFRKLVPLRKWLRKRGMPAPKISDAPEQRMRTWNYGRVCLYGTLPQDGAACRYEQVGVEEKPVYKLVCPEYPAMPAMDESEVDQ